MARKKKAPRQVDAIVHDDKRTNIPTADAQMYVTPQVEAPRQVLWERDPTLDPQLVWKGKDDTDAEPLSVTSAPIYIQEKIDPRVLIDNLRTQSDAHAPSEEATLFDSFDGLDELASVEFYQHAANWSNRMILGDSLEVMTSLADRERLRGKVQCIYLDPPYGIKFGSNWQVSARNRNVKDGKADDATRQVEQIKAFRDTWELGIHSYLNYLRDRLVVARDLLTESGSIFVQIGDENVHLVRSLLDEVFGAENYLTTIVIRKTTSEGSAFLGSTTDFVMAYEKITGEAKFRQLFVPRSESASARYDQVMLQDGSCRSANTIEKATGDLPAGATLYRTDNLTSSRPAREGDLREFTYEGEHFTPGAGTFKSNKDGLERLAAAQRLQASNRGTLSYRRFARDFGYAPVTNLWSDISGAVQSRSDPKIYVVQSSTSLMERCILMATDPGDLVLDPTCGSGTAAYVAEQWGRRWITIDSSRVALALARQRLMGAKFPYYLLADSPEGRLKEGQVSGTPLPDAPTHGDIRQGFVYERVPHITLKSIANNPDIVEGMTRDEIDAAIRRHADSETLYDKPYVDRNTVRVTGPFTVESLSPHRSVAFAGGPEEPATERAAAAAPDAETFEAMILENLQRAGIQNGIRDERLRFATVEAYAGVHIQAVGDQTALDGGTDAAPGRVGIAVGPQYGTVDGSFIKDAAREAIEAGDIDLLCVLGFAFDPNATGATDEYVSSKDGFASVTAERQLGRVPILLVRMNADLVMGAELKKTGAGNLFTVFGEPDIGITVTDDDRVVVTLRGVDVFDPTTGQVRSADTGQIAMWMIDSDYNGESFFVRHCYFTGGNDPFKRLKRELKAEIDADAWATLYRTESVPFDKPTTGRIAVKVIDDYGDEVLQTFDVE